MMLRECGQLITPHTYVFFFFTPWRPAAQVLAFARRADCDAAMQRLQGRCLQLRLAGAWPRTDLLGA